MEISFFYGRETLPYLLWSDYYGTELRKMQKENSLQYPGFEIY